YGGFMRF
nr:Met-enkephalin-Arg-Phe - rabbit [Oryctolagus cuniculus]